MAAVLMVVSGPSGAGKSTLCTRLRARFPEIGLSVSYTTRAIRAGEEDGVHYHFIDHARFEAMVEEGAFVEWASVHGNYYGTSWSAVRSALEGGTPLLFDIDYQGAASLRSAFPDAVTVMLLPPDLSTLEARLRGRGTDEDGVIGQRLLNARGEIGQTAAFDYIIFNDDLDRAYEELSSIHIAAQARTALRLTAARERFPGFL